MMASDTEQVTDVTPDEQLTAMIVHELLERSLIRASDADAIRTRMATGQATPDDWTFWVENVLDRPGKKVVDDAI